MSLYNKIKKLSYKKYRALWLGYISELLIIFWLKCLLYKILVHRYVSYCGEIDIIAIKNDKLLFIEVKARKDMRDFERCFRHQQRLRIKKTAEQFLANYSQIANTNYQIYFLFYYIQWSKILPKISCIDWSYEFCMSKRY